MYKSLIKPVLFKCDPESVHDFFVASGEFLGKTSVGRGVVSSFSTNIPEGIAVEVDGLTYRSPVLLAAGFDYNGRLARILPALGFGGEEIGSVTARPCAGNPKPRLTRLPKDRSIIVNKGLANDGVEEVIKRMSNTALEEGFVVGVSIARTNSREVSSVEKGIEDYLTSLLRLTEESAGDYYAINISCPNAFGGESFADPNLSDKLFDSLDTIDDTKPRYVKMPISISDEKFIELLSVLERHKVDGVIIGNLMKDYNTLTNEKDRKRAYSGGLSGKPTSKRSNHLISKTKKLYGDRFTIIGCGGIFSPEDALTKMSLGADLLQLITGMIYEGPGLIGDINKTLVKTNARIL